MKIVGQLSQEYIKKTTRNLVAQEKSPFTFLHSILDNCNYTQQTKQCANFMLGFVLTLGITEDTYK